MTRPARLAIAVLGIALINLAAGVTPARAGCQPPGGHSLTLLPDGRVLVLVGSTYSDYTFHAQIYDPASGAWSPAAIPGMGGQEATLLPNGKVLLTGIVCGTSTNQLYDPLSNTTSTAANMLDMNRCGFTATALRTGKVLAVGGGCTGPGSEGELPSERSAEVYDSARNTWTPAARTAEPRSDHQAVLLADGRILVVGGRADSATGYGPLVRRTSELYDPTTNSWSLAGILTMTDRSSGLYALLPLGDGTVLRAGGADDGLPTASAEIFDPATRSWSPTSPMTEPRAGGNAVLLADGTALVVGGSGLGGRPLADAEIYHPSTRTWTLLATNLKSATASKSAILLRSGAVLVVNWPDGAWSPSEAERYDPRTAGAAPALPTPAIGPGHWSGAASMSLPRSGHTAVRLIDGRVLALSWGVDITSGVTPELYDPKADRWSAAATPLTHMTSNRMSATLLRNGKVLVIGDDAELYDASLNRWSKAGTMNWSRNYHTATLLSDGRVLVTGGVQNNQQLSSTEIYNPTTNAWAIGPAMHAPRSNHQAALLKNGRVLVVGRYGAPVDAEIFDPRDLTMSPAGSMPEIRDGFTLTALPDGNALVAGGVDASHAPSVEDAPYLYDPKKNTWFPAARMSVNRRDHTATLLPNGLVLVAGGFASGFVTGSAELYDPTADSWTTTGSLAVARAGSAATLLSDGRVLVTGGSFFAPLRLTDIYTPTAVQAPHTDGTISGAPSSGGALSVLARVPVILAVVGAAGPILVIASVSVLLRRRRRRG